MKSKAKSILDLFEQTPDSSMGDYFDKYQSYFSPSDWGKITSLYKRILGIPFAQLVGTEERNSISANIMNVLVQPHAVPTTVGQQTFFNYWSGGYKDRPFIVGGFGDEADAPPNLLFIRKMDQGAWQKEFEGKLK